MATTYYSNIQQLYVAYFNRPADPAGLAYWETVVEANKGSTAAVSATFAASAEYKATYAGMANADIVNAVYLNLFGRAAEDAGKAYWANLLNTGKITIDGVVTAVAAGAQTTDLTAYNNKVTAAGVFTAAVDTAAEQAGYSGTAANAVGKSYLASVTDNASLVAATTPTALNTSVANAVSAGTTFSVTTALGQVAAAQAAQAAYITATATVDVNNDGVKNATDITLTQTNALNKVAADLTGGAAGAQGQLYVAASTSQTVRDALVSAQQATNANALTNAQAKVTADNASIAKVAGLTDAVSLLTASQSAQKTAIAAEVTTHADINAKEAAFGINNGGGSAVTLVSGHLVFTNSSGASVTLADIGTNGQATLTSGVDATKYVGLTDLITSYNAEATATSNVTKAAANVSNAQLIVNMLDIAPDSVGTISVNGTAYTESALIAAITTQINATTAGTVATGATPTLAQIQTELAVLHAQTDQTAYNNFNALITAESNPQNVSSTNLTAAQNTLSTAQTTLSNDTTTYNNANSAYTTAGANFDGGSNVSVSGSNLVFTANGATTATVLATIGSNGQATVASGITDSTNAGVTNLIAKFNATASASATVTQDQAAVTTAQNAVTTAQAAVTTGLNPLSATLAADTSSVTTANNTISTFAKDVAALATANANSATLAGNQATIDAYNKVLTDKGYVVTTLDTAHSGLNTQFGTAASDVYIVSGKSATIGAFGLQGSDSLFVGSGYTVVKGAIGSTGVTGNNANMEIFVSTNSNGDAQLQIETHAYSSSVASTAGEVVTITLTGVDATTLQLNNGIITSVHA